MRNTRKLIALAMCAMALLGVLAGCGNDTEQNPTGATGEGITTPVAEGMLVLNAGASVNISYDGDGLVLDVQGADENGTSLASEYEDYLGKPCGEAVADLIRSAIVGEYLTKEADDVIIKQAVGSALPGANFLETIVTGAESAAKDAGVEANIVQITEAELDANGYINLATAKVLLLADLNLESFDTLDGTAEPIEGNYCFSIVAGTTEGTYIVDGVTGDVYEGVLDGYEVEDEYVDEAPLDDETAEDQTNNVTQPGETTPATDATEDDPTEATAND